ncbi:Chitin synthase, class 3, partial [Podila epicladia]
MHTQPDIEGQESSYGGPQARRPSGPGTGPSLTIDAANRPSGPRPGANFKRQKSLVRPERERIDRNHPQYFYRNATQNLDGSNIKVQASTTGNDPSAPMNRATGVRRGKSVLGREPEKPEGLRARPKPQPKRRLEVKNPLKNTTREWPSSWIMYYNAITCCFPAALLRSCGMHTHEIQKAWREKIALVSLVIFMVLAVAFLTFGLQKALCRDESTGKFVAGSPDTATGMIINGMGYYFNAKDEGGAGVVWTHPAIATNISSERVDIMSDPTFGASGKDASFLFQNPTGGACSDLITRIAPPDVEGDYYFPCKLRDIFGTTPPNMSVDRGIIGCHTNVRGQWNALARSAPIAPAYYTWENITRGDRNLFAFDGDVIDADILKWIKTDQFTVSDSIAALRNGSIPLQRDLSFLFAKSKMSNLGACVKQIARVGAMDSKTIGCMTADVIT